ncbi:DEAD/DEAH box helicase [Tuwongella immobilis]|uniref:Helicase/UvrB N-terminal domain-containing protein n=1 Tax=Tuwongella immobilis TaxID=692036 RepID=A0A6C2YQ34_9BACT|nr:DEAD/DEAH box helicase family protein [Tuwongella immobilis]VIP03748.1 type iii restriction res subunit : Type III restriction enzyme, res subunit, putative OS=Rhodospirillum centenum (strain ATCC 51521 / SW) GN=RC1_0095 PE=4 SV=1: ResIII [Tuwongella immobilis]VTS04864.1 type iii restriction res subunit : Type III restriction enzyme, res subunit, putative OS=Rhodospirillum centenum (strain ATCC 51521 / SW) GN=RC1_0095 PE=4 SV=1: ResIII [Tuwongella immobilis]
MNRHVNNITGRLSLRSPQRQSLEVLARVCEILPLKKLNRQDAEDAEKKLKEAFPQVTDFEREFPSLCFALATGVGKTRLMGAFISYLYLAHGIRNFFVLAPNLTIYNKLITDFKERTHPKYVFQGIQDFAINPPTIITGDNYESQAITLFDQPDDCKVNIFNISKINSEVRGGKSPRIKRLSEYIGESYFEYLSKLPDLVLLMDESHRYRASAGVRAINELKPILGLELTATPFVETPKGAIPFKNVVVDYPLARAMADGFVKEPAVVTRKDFNPAGMSNDDLERMKLEDGVRLHEQVKVELETYARQTGQKIVKPFVLVIARDTTHASQLLDLIRSETFFDGRYKERAIQVDSSKTGAEEDKMIQDLLAVEATTSPTEIVIHVNMLKEGWDVTNLYTIVPLRAANARILIEQSIGRGLRLPYGKRTGVNPVDRLNIIAHDKFQEIIDEAKRPESPIRLQQLVLDPSQLGQTMVTVISKSTIQEMLEDQPQRLQDAETTNSGSASVPPRRSGSIFTPQEQKVAQVAYEVIRSYESQTDVAPTLASLQNSEVQSKVVAEVKRRLGSQQLEMFTESEQIAEVVAKTTEHVVMGTIDIPRIVVIPKDEVRCGFKPFQLNLTSLRFPVPSDELVAQKLRTGEQESISVGRGGIEEQRLEDYVVGGLVDFDDVSYDDHAELLYDLANQTVNHLKSYLKDEFEVRKVLRVHQKPISDFIHAQMLEHFWEESTGYDVEVRKGFTQLRTSAYTASANDSVLDYRQPPADKSKITQYLFNGFHRSLYRLTKFQSDPERKLAILLERDAMRWFRPAKGQFQIFFKQGHEQQEYQPDFVAETTDTIFMIETKRASELNDSIVLAKRDAAVQWCENASKYAKQHNGKEWKYLLIPHDVIAENMSLIGLAESYVEGVK